VRNHSENEQASFAVRLECFASADLRVGRVGYIPDLEDAMLKIYKGEQRGGRIKFTSDRDCLPPDAIRVETSYYHNLEGLQNVAKIYERRGFVVCIDTEELFYETANRL